MLFVGGATRCVAESFARMAWVCGHYHYHRRHLCRGGGYGRERHCKPVVTLAVLLIKRIVNRFRIGGMSMMWLVETKE